MSVEESFETLLNRKAQYINKIKESIDQLYSIRSDLEKQVDSCKISNTVGNSVSIASTSLLFTPFAAFGAFGLVLGALTSIGTSITQHCLEKGQLGRLKWLFEREEETATNYYDAVREFSILLLRDKMPYSSAQTFGGLDAFGVSKILNGINILKTAQPAVSASASINDAAALLKISKKVKVAGMLGVAFSAADIIMTWTIKNPSLSEIDNVINAKKEILKNQEEEYLRFKNSLKEQNKTNFN